MKIYKLIDSKGGYVGHFNSLDTAIECLKISYQNMHPKISFKEAGTKITIETNVSTMEYTLLVQKLIVTPQHL